MVTATATIVAIAMAITTVPERVTVPVTGRDSAKRTATFTAIGPRAYAARGHRVPHPAPLMRQRPEIGRRRPRGNRSNPVRATMYTRTGTAIFTASKVTAGRSERETTGRPRVIDRVLSGTGRTSTVIITLGSEETRRPISPARPVPVPVAAGEGKPELFDLSSLSGARVYW